MNNTCANCKHWKPANIFDRDEYTFEPSTELGVCQKILHAGMNGYFDMPQDGFNESMIDDKNRLAGTFDGEDYLSGLVSRGSFGCVLFEQK